MKTITRPSIARLSKRAGVKSVSEDCFENIRDIIEYKLTEVIKASLIVNSEHQTKTLMADDVYEGIRLLGYNITQSNDMGTNTFNKG